MNKMMNSFLNYVPNEDWIKSSSGLPWLKLDLDIPTEAMVAEAMNLFAKSVEHRSQDILLSYSNQGWRSICLYGIDAQTTGHVEGAKLDWTDVIDRCPATVAFVKENWKIDHTTGRIRFMYLEPGGYILPHEDRTYKGFTEVNIAITNPDKCQFRFLNYGKVPFAPGSAFFVDLSNKHFVVNESENVRIHLIVHGVLKDGIVKSSYAQSFYS